MIRLYSFLFLFPLVVGCASVSHRSHPLTSPLDSKKVSLSVELVVHGVYKDDLNSFIKESLPFSTIAPTKNTDSLEKWRQAYSKFEDFEEPLNSAAHATDYKLEIIMHMNGSDRPLWSWLAIPTLGIFPAKETEYINLAAKLSNKRTKISKRYYYPGSVTYWFSSLPIFWEYFLRPNALSEDLEKSLIAALAKDLAKDLAHE